MKKGIHPKYVESTIVCACGNTVHTRAAKESIHVEICSNCHPYYTGKQKLVDSAGRVDRFKKRYANTKPVQTKAEAADNSEKTESQDTNKGHQTQQES